jgi:Phosphopantetheine attachment site.
MTIASDWQAKILELVAAAGPSKLRKRKITPETQLRRDLGLDSVAILALVFQFEQAFELDLAKLSLDIDLARLRTVGDVLATAETIFLRAESSRAADHP